MKGAFLFIFFTLSTFANPASEHAGAYVTFMYQVSQAENDLAWWAAQRTSDEKLSKFTTVIMSDSRYLINTMRALGNEIDQKIEGLSSTERMWIDDIKNASKEEFDQIYLEKLELFLSGVITQLRVGYQTVSEPNVREWIQKSTSIFEQHLMLVKFLK